MSHSPFHYLIFPITAILGLASLILLVFMFRPSYSKYPFPPSPPS